MIQVAEAYRVGGQLLTLKQHVRQWDGLYHLVLQCLFGKKRLLFMQSWWRTFNPKTVCPYMGWLISLGLATS